MISCNSTGIVYISYSSGGGFVGRNGGSIEMSCSDCEFSVSVGDVNVGGFVASNLSTGSISYCFAKGSIRAYGGSLGGFCASNSGSIANSYSDTDCQSVNVGGFVYSNSGTVINCYTSGSVTTRDYLEWADYYGNVVSAGFVISNSGTISNCYAVGDLYASTRSESLSHLAKICTFYNTNSGTITNCFAASNVSKTAVGLMTSIVENGTQLTIEEILTIEFHNNTLNWSDEVWKFENGEYPSLVLADIE